MTVGGSGQPSVPFERDGQGMPPGPDTATPPAGTPPAKRRHGLLVALAAVVGLVVGAGIVGAVWAGRGSEAAALPAPIQISLATLPTEVLGAKRDDLASSALGKGAGGAAAGSGAAASAGSGGGTAGAGGPQAIASAQVALYQAGIPQLKKAYGGPGIRAGYGAVAGGTTYTLTIVNGMASVPTPSSDALIRQLGAVTGSTPVEVPGTATAVCVAAPSAAPITVTQAGGVAGARRAAADATQAVVTCARHDWTRNLSVVLVGVTTGTSGPTAATQARRMANEVDTIWTGLGTG